MRHSKPLLATVAFAMTALLAGCGGGGDTSATSDTSATTTTTQTTTQPHEQKSNKAKQKSADAKGAKPYSGPAPTDPNPLPNQGTKAVAPGVPTTHGGDNSIQLYGTEADVSDRVKVATTAKAYLDAQRAGQWDRACTYLNAKVRSGLEGLTQKAQAKGSSIQGCAGAMGALLGKAPQKVLNKAADIHVLSLRVKGEQAFVVYRDGAGKPFNLPLNREGGAWKIGALVGVALVL